MDTGKGRRHPIGCPGGMQDMTIINRIMLRFRPIAPKPASAGQDPRVPPETDKSSLSGSKRRTKRKYVRVLKHDRNSKKVPLSSCSSDQPQDTGGRRDADDDFEFKQVRTTLQLLPEKSDYLNESPTGTSRGGLSWCNNPDLLTAAANGQFQGNHHLGCAAHEIFSLKLKQPEIEHIHGRGEATAAVTVPERTKVVVESWVTVECVTDTCNSCMDGRAVILLGCTDEERVKNLETDTCPGFISDGSNNVRWVNGAYKRLVTAKRECITTINWASSPEIKVIVRLAIKEELLPFLSFSAPMFTCWVRLQYTWQKDKCSQIVPCDVWRMDSGGFAWRLDAEAALSLGHR